MACCGPCASGSGPCVNAYALGRPVKVLRRSGAVLGSLSVSAQADGREEGRRRAAVRGEPIIPTQEEFCAKYPYFPGCGSGGTGGGGTGLPSLPPELPGMVTTEECAAREEQAYDRGRSAERSSLILPAVITAAVTGVVGVALGRIFS